MLSGGSHNKEVAATITSQCWSKPGSSTPGRGRIRSYDELIKIMQCLLDFSSVYFLLPQLLNGQHRESCLSIFLIQFNGGN
jgi:hypothetical protein